MVKNFYLVAFMVILPLCECALSAMIDNIPGIVPKKESRPPASDLLFNKNILSSSEILKMEKNGTNLSKFETRVLLPREAKELGTILKTVGLDISHVNPSESDIWKNIESKHVELQHDDLGFDCDGSKCLDVVNYAGTILSQNGRFRFSALKDSSSGSVNFSFMLSQKLHNVLLRAALLRKLGYVVPEIKWLPSIRVKFSSRFEKEEFVKRMSENTFGAPARWVVENEEDGKELLLQDVLVMSGNDYYYNLALGCVVKSVVRGRRALNSLLIPYSLTDVPESINLFSWHAGKIVSENVKLDYESADSFSTSYEDAKWILRRLFKLNRSDFIEIAKFGKFPKEVELLVVEKLISRRDNLATLFDMDSDSNPLGYETEISKGRWLKKGKLLKENWDGYASRFSYGDPESPLSNSEILAFFRSKFRSNVLSNLVSFFNNNYAFQTSKDAVKQEVFEHQQELAKKQFLNFLKTGKNSEVNFGSWAIPNYGMDLIISRDIIAGSYLGTDNLVQLADTIGISVEAGAYIFTDGAPVPWIINGSAKVHLNRRYTHLRPIKSMKMALKTPFRNILVPWLKKKRGRIFNEFLYHDKKYADHEKWLLWEINNKKNEKENAISDLDKLEIDEAEKSKKLKEIQKQYHEWENNVEKLEKLEGEERNKFLSKMKTEDQQERLTKVLAVFKEKLTIGESIMITDSLGAGLDLGAGVKFTDLLRARVGFNASQLVVSRLHIHRKNENTIHIYKDLGAAGSVGLSLTIANKFPIGDFEAELPIIKAALKSTKGRGKTKFYQLNIDDDLKKNSDAVFNIKALVQILKKNSLEYMETERKPYVLKHKFVEHSGIFSSFIWKNTRKTTADIIEITHPDGYQKDEETIINDDLRSYYYRRLVGTRTGKDYQGAVLDVLNSLISGAMDDDWALTSPGNNNAADTFGGSGVTRKVVFDGKVLDYHDGKGRFSKAFAHLTYLWKGWKISYKKANKIIQQINKKYKFGFFTKDVLHTTESLQLYSIYLNIYFYQDAINYMASVSEKRVEKIFKSNEMLKIHQRYYQLNKYGRYSSKEERVDREKRRKLIWLISTFKRAQEKYKKYLREGNLKKLTSYGVKMASIIEATLSLNGILKMVGGKKNIYISSRIQGFREGDENGDRAIISNSIGRVGNGDYLGPVSAIKDRLGMTDSEFFISWILGRL